MKILNDLIPLLLIWISILILVRLSIDLGLYLYKKVIHPYLVERKRRKLMNQVKSFINEIIDDEEDDKEFDAEEINSKLKERFPDLNHEVKVFKKEDLN